MNTTHRILTLALSLGLSACQVPMKLSHVVTGQPEAPHGGPVRVVMESEAPPKDFREIAIVQATTYGAEADLAHVVRGLQARAAQLGCTVIVRVHIDQGNGMASGNGVCGVVE